MGGPLIKKTIGHIAGVSLQQSTGLRFMMPLVFSNYAG